MDELFRSETPTEEIKLVKDVVQEILKAKKVMRMYPPNNPIYIKTSETLYDKFKNSFLLNNKLILKVHQKELIFKNEQVYYNPQKDDNLALFLFKDGIIELAFLEGISKKELEDFIKILNMDFEAEAPDDDVVTFFWDRNFEHIKYVVDENFLSNWKIPDKDKISDEAVTTAYNDGLKAEKARVNILLDISSTHRQYIAREIEQQGQPKIGKIIIILFELLYQTKDSTNFTEIVRLIETAIYYCITRTDFKNASHILNMVKTVNESKPFSDKEIRDLNTIYTTINSNTYIEGIGMALESKATIEENDFIIYIKNLNESTTPFFIQLLGKSQTIKSRRLIIEALSIIGQLDINTLANGLYDSRWYVVRNIALIMGKIAAPDSIGYLTNILSHNDLRVRKEAIKAIGNIRSPDTLQYLKEAFNDNEQSIRITAAIAIGNIKTEDAKRMLLVELSRKNFSKRGFNEKRNVLRLLRAGKTKR